MMNTPRISPGLVCNSWFGGQTKNDCSIKTSHVNRHYLVDCDGSLERCSVGVSPLVGPFHLASQCEGKPQLVLLRLAGGASEVCRRRESVSSAGLMATWPAAPAAATVGQPCFLRTSASWVRVTLSRSQVRVIDVCIMQLRVG